MVDSLLDFKERLKNISPISFKVIYFHSFEKGIPSLSTYNYKYANGRWHIKGEFGGLYSGENKKLCQEENKRVYGIIPPVREYRIVKLRLSLSKVLDLTDPDNLKRLNIKEKQILSGQGHKAETVIIPNSIAKSAYDLGFEAIIFPSATGLGKAIVLYKDNFSISSSIEELSENKLF